MSKYTYLGVEHNPLSSDGFSKIKFDGSLHEKKEIPDWNEYFLDICEKIAERSSDKNTRFGAVFVKNKAILSTGYNGFPSGMPDSLLPNTRDESGAKYNAVIHAETNGIYFAARHGISLDGATLYIQGHPCSECCKALIQVGVKDWVIGDREYKASEEEVLRRQFWVYHGGVSIRKYKKL